MEQFNRLDSAAAEALISTCCGSARWAARMAAARPFASIERLRAAADECWQSMAQADFLEAFRGHPKIGDARTNQPRGGEPSCGRPHPARAAAMAAAEQASVATASARVIQALAQCNRDYEKKFGFIFIVCASGKTAEQMLGLMQARMGNPRNAEIANAAEQQRNITQLRIDKLFEAP